MTTTTTNPPTADELGVIGAETYYGVEVRTIGEDGALIAVGHHEPRRVIAAFNAYVREYLGYQNLDDYRPRFGDLASRIDRVWLALVPWCGDCDDPHECEACPTGTRWWLQVVAERPGAFPAMWLD